MKHSRKTLQLIRSLTLAALLCTFLSVGAIGADAATSGKGGPTKPSAKATPTPRSLPMLIDVGADSCIPCRMMAPILGDLEKEYEGILTVQFVDAWKNPEEAQKYRVRGIPTQIFYDASGKELGRHMGYISKEDILKGFEQLGVFLKKPAVK